ncbi:hypothetical protein [Streptomyces hainanensis]|nr:hypothetical protein [Streptomyces hainanensis]
MLRPIGGGREWEARFDDLRHEVSAHPRPVDIEQLRAARRLHIVECEVCARAQETCRMGEILNTTINTAGGRAESVDFDDGASRPAPTPWDPTPAAASLPPA